MEFSGIGAVQLQNAQLLTGVIVDTNLIVISICNLHIQNQGGIAALFLCIGELEADAGYHAPSAGTNIHLQSLRSQGAFYTAGSIAIVLCLGAKAQPVIKQLCIQHIIKFCYAVAGIQTINTGYRLGIQGSCPVTQGSNPDISLFTGQSNLCFGYHRFLAVELHCIALCAVYRCPGCLIAGYGQLGIGQEFCDGNAVHIQQHIVEVARFSVEAKLNGIGRISAFIEGRIGIIGSIGIHTDMLGSICGNIESLPFSGLQAANTCGKGSCGGILFPEGNIVAGKQEGILNIFRLYIHAHCQVFALQILL